jgi:tetratricopeptide (TPR) repeat protein
MTSGSVAKPSETEPSDGRTVRKSLLGLIVVLGALVMGVVHWERSRERLTVSRVLSDIEIQVQILQRKGELREQQLQANIELLKRIEALDPSESAIPLQIGSHYLLMQRPSAAVRWYEKALALEPRPEVLANLSLAYRMANDAEQANEYLRKAQILDPKRFGAIPPATEIAAHSAETSSGAKGERGDLP